MMYDFTHFTRAYSIKCNLTRLGFIGVGLFHFSLTELGLIVLFTSCIDFLWYKKETGTGNIKISKKFYKGRKMNFFLKLF